MHRSAPRVRGVLRAYYACFEHLFIGITGVVRDKGRSLS